MVLLHDVEGFREQSACHSLGVRGACVLSQLSDAQTARWRQAVEDDEQSGCRCRASLRVYLALCVSRFGAMTKSSDEETSSFP